jgi:hypothetical protein
MHITKWLITINMQSDIDKPMKLKVLIVTDFDSRIAWSSAFAALFAKRDYAVDVMLPKSVIESFPHERYSFIDQKFAYRNVDEIVRQMIEGEYGVLLLGIGGALHLKIIASIIHTIEKSRNLIRRPIIVSGFNGIEDINDPHGLFCRTGSDLICINSPKIFEAYTNFLNQMGHSAQSIRLMGYIRNYWDVDMSECESGRIQKVLFVLQPGISDHPKQLEYQGQKIIEYCERYPDRDFCLKPRGPKKGLHVNTAVEKKYYKGFWENLAQKGPSNLIITYDDISELLLQSDLVISYTSAALIEAAILNKKVAAISDFGISRAIGNVYLTGSGVLCSFDDLLEDRIPEMNQQWREENIAFSKQNVNDMIDEIESLLKRQDSGEGALPFNTMVYSPEKNGYLFRLVVRDDKPTSFLQYWIKLLNRI